MRLKEFNTPRETWLLRCFNSNLVRLKDGHGFPVLRKYLRFNSNLVRLKVGGESAVIVTFVMFQFQSGAIKGCGLLLRHPERTAVSIPIWCD